MTFFRCFQALRQSRTKSPKQPVKPRPATYRASDQIGQNFGAPTFFSILIGWRPASGGLRCARDYFSVCDPSLSGKVRCLRTCERGEKWRERETIWPVCMFWWTLALDHCWSVWQKIYLNIKSFAFCCDARMMMSVVKMILMSAKNVFHLLKCQN